MDRSLSRWASDYVNLMLAVGRHDGDFVDAYYGPKAWKQVAEAGEPRPLAELRAGRMRGVADDRKPAPRRRLQRVVAVARQH